MQLMNCLIAFRSLPAKGDADRRFSLRSRHDMRIGQQMLRERDRCERVQDCRAVSYLLRPPYKHCTLYMYNMS